MSVDTTEHYKLALQQHNHAADHRAKIIHGWCLMVATLAAAAWYAAEARLVIVLIGIFATVFMWALDLRTRDGLKDWRRIGGEIEKTMPEKQRYFQQVSANASSPKHGPLLDGCVFGIIVIFAFLTICFVCDNDSFASSVAGVKFPYILNNSSPIIAALGWIIIGAAVLLICGGCRLWLQIRRRKIITFGDLSGKIQDRACAIWEALGKPKNKDKEIWLLAEKDVLKEWKIAVVKCVWLDN